MDPARTFMESLTPRPELENSQGHQHALSRAVQLFRFIPISRPNSASSPRPSGARQVTLAQLIALTEPHCSSSCLRIIRPVFKYAEFKTRDERVVFIGRQARVI
jgi:hypothetical protein